MSYHYTKSGNLDMRYSSSKAYVSSNPGYSGGFVSSSSNSGGFVSSSSNSGSSIHLKRDGTPDMRYRENRTPGCNMDGSPDRRFTSNSGNSPITMKSSGQHLKKDGSPDLRFKENRTPGLNKDGSADKRFTGQPHKSSELTKNGTADMRLKKNRISGQNIDGSPDRRFSMNRSSKYGGKDHQFRNNNSSEEMFFFPDNQFLFDMFEQAVLNEGSSLQPVVTFNPHLPFTLCCKSCGHVIESFKFFPGENDDIPRIFDLDLEGLSVILHAPKNTPVLFFTNSDEKTLSTDLEKVKQIYSAEDETAYEPIICKCGNWIGAQVKSTSSKYIATLDGQYLMINNLNVCQKNNQCPFSDLI